MCVLTWNITPDWDNGVWVVALYGELTPRSMSRVRSIVLKCLADCPAALVIDLHACRVGPHMSLALLTTLQQHARDRGVRLLYTADEALAGRIRRDAARWFVELFPTLAQAEAAALEPGTHRWLRIEEVNPGPLTSGEARLQVGLACMAWGVGHVAHRARAIVSELVDNAVTYAGPPIEVTVAALRDLLHIRVRDHSHRQPVRGEPRAGDPAAGPGVGSRGLWLVEQHATSWGVTPTEDGKIVWATIRTRPIQPREPVRSGGAGRR